MAKPAPKPEPKDDLDVILEAIDRDLPKVHRMCAKRANGQPSPPSPTSAFSPAQQQRARTMFQTMAADPIDMESDVAEVLEPATNSRQPLKRKALG